MNRCSCQIVVRDARNRHRGSVELNQLVRRNRRKESTGHIKQLTRSGRENLYPRITHRWSSTSTAPAMRSMSAGLRRIRELQLATSDRPDLFSCLGPPLQPSAMA